MIRVSSALLFAASSASAHTTAVCTATAKSDPKGLTLMIGTYHNGEPSPGTATFEGLQSATSPFGVQCDLGQANPKATLLQTESTDSVTARIKSTCSDKNYTSSRGFSRRMIPDDAVITCYGNDAGKASTSTIQFNAPLPGSSPMHCHNDNTNRPVETIFLLHYEDQVSGEYKFSWAGIDVVLDQGMAGSTPPCSTVTGWTNYMNVVVNPGGDPCVSPAPVFAGSGFANNDCANSPPGTLCGYVCDDSAAERIGSVECMPDGQWQGTITCSKESLCEKPGLTTSIVGMGADAPQGIFNTEGKCGFKTESGTLCDFSCVNGATKYGDAKLRCNEPEIGAQYGEWSMEGSYRCVSFFLVINSLEANLPGGGVKGDSRFDEYTDNIEAILEAGINAAAGSITFLNVEAEGASVTGATSSRRLQASSSTTSVLTFLVDDSLMPQAARDLDETLALGSFCSDISNLINCGRGGTPRRVAAIAKVDEAVAETSTIVSDAYESFLGAADAADPAVTESLAQVVGVLEIYTTASVDLEQYPTNAALITKQADALVELNSALDDLANASAVIFVGKLEYLSGDAKIEATSSIVGALSNMTVSFVDLTKAAADESKATMVDDVANSAALVETIKADVDTVARRSRYAADSVLTEEATAKEEVTAAETRAKAQADADAASDGNGDTAAASSSLVPIIASIGGVVFLGTIAILIRRNRMAKKNRMKRSGFDDMAATPRVANMGGASSWAAGSSVGAASGKKALKVASKAAAKDRKMSARSSKRVTPKVGRKASAAAMPVENLEAIPMAVAAVPPAKPNSKAPAVPSTNKKAPKPNAAAPNIPTAKPPAAKPLIGGKPAMPASKPSASPAGKRTRVSPAAGRAKPAAGRK